MTRITFVSGTLNYKILTFSKIRPGNNLKFEWNENGNLFLIDFPVFRKHDRKTRQGEGRF